MGDPLIHWFHIDSIMERAEGSRSQCGLKWKGIVPRLGGSIRRRDIGRWSDPPHERMEEVGIRGEMRIGLLRKNLSSLAMIWAEPDLLLE
jgi:hypothetical protein